MNLGEGILGIGWPWPGPGPGPFIRGEGRAGIYGGGPLNPLGDGNGGMCGLGSNPG